MGKSARHRKDSIKKASAVLTTCKINIKSMILSITNPLLWMTFFSPDPALSTPVFCFVLLFESEKASSFKMKKTTTTTTEDEEKTHATSDLNILSATTVQSLGSVLSF